MDILGFSDGVLLWLPCLGHQEPPSSIFKSQQSYQQCCIDSCHCTDIQSKLDVYLITAFCKRIFYSWIYVNDKSHILAGILMFSSRYKMSPTPLQARLLSVLQHDTTWILQLHKNTYHSNCLSGGKSAAWMAVIPYMVSISCPSQRKTEMHLMCM